MAGKRGAGIKVVIINTQYVETDAMSFKSVVQNLTGKNSHAAVADSRQPRTPMRIQSSTQVAYNMAPFLSRGMSFRDFEWMPNDWPPLDELLQALR